MKRGDRVEVSLSSKGNVREAASGRLVVIVGRQAVVRLDKECGGARIRVHVGNLTWAPSQKQIAKDCAPIIDRMTPYERWRRSGGADGANDEFHLTPPEIARMDLHHASAKIE